MAQLHGPTIDPAGQYKAVELMGKGLVRLVKVGESPAPDQDTIRVRIPKALARAAGAQKLFGESLDEVVARLLADALKSAGKYGQASRTAGRGITRGRK